MAFSPETYGAVKGLGGAAGGFATLDSDGKVPEEQLPRGGGGLPPVTGSGKALVSVNGQWKQQEGFPYAEELAETKFDETFTGFTRKWSAWVATVPLDSGVEFGSEKNYRVYIDGEVVEDAYVHETYIELDERGNNYVEFEENDDGFIATVWLFAADYDAAPASMEIKVNEVFSGLHTLDAKYIPWYDAPEGTGFPDAPTEDGTYTLTATVTDGEVSYDWTPLPNAEGNTFGGDTE